MTHTLKINPSTGLLEGVAFCLSPHHDLRPEGVTVDMIVVHGISLPAGKFGSDAVQAFFCGKLDISSDTSFTEIANLKVSAHLFIKRTGDIIQFVPFSKRAWHAGVSYFNGKSHCNDFSIGIELEGTDHIPYESVQYEQLAKIIRLLKQVYPAITNDRIVGHLDIAPGRKTDPGPAFDWDHLKGIIV